MAEDSRSRPGLPSVPDTFRGNKVFGRLVTGELPTPPPKLLQRQPGRCSEALVKAKQEYAAKSLFDKMLTVKDAWGNPKDQQAAALFKQQCEQWPERIAESFLDEQRQRLNDHLSGKSPLLPAESVRLRRDLSLMEDIYCPGPRFEAPLSAAEQNWLDERNLSFGNSLSMALLGPIFGGPGAATRMLGGSEQQVAAANQMGAVVMDMTTGHAAIGGVRPSHLGAYPAQGRTVVRGAPTESLGGWPSGSSGVKQGSVGNWELKFGARPVVTTFVGTVVAKPPPFISAEMELKILYGQRVLSANGNPTNRLVGAHGGQITDKHPSYAVEVVSVNLDGTRNAKLVTQFSDGNISKVKTSTLFPEGWNDAQAMSAVRQTAATAPLATRLSDGASLHQSMVNGVRVEVISVGGTVTAAYPCGRGCTNPGSF
ncbi:EndoU nuclease-like protein [Tahibacter aquaticus]|uniref:EndoU nuclease-like protein n=1 Tax=Tahibacter aquaticus TaxID=520092 RepID=A0A4R6YNS2_9GAMM|nr:EndoU domain-containing protein [Tahibacter aquaticus]TDR39315.1 EndoU nuclease-like protein [Tahibacter aquaticus]